MLILARSEGEEVRIGDDVKVSVVKIENGRVVLGFDAPDDVIIHREEIHQKLNDEGEVEDAGNKTA